MRGDRSAANVILSEAKDLFFLHARADPSSLTPLRMTDVLRLWSLHRAQNLAEQTTDMR
jgi:hypothetical protein